MATSYEKRRADFGRRMRALREQAGLNGKQLAEQLGWNAPKLSRFETGKHTVSQEDFDSWLTVLSVPDAVAASLRADLEAIREEHVSWRQRFKAGYAARQEESVQREASAKLIRAVDVGLVPGLVQTADYARHVLLAVASVHGGGSDITDAVRARMRRQQILWQPGRSIEILMTESALLHPIAPADVMVGQIHRLIATIGTPNVRFGILPARAQLPYFLSHGYWIVDNLVMVELVDGEYTTHDPDRVATYMEVTDRLWQAAVEGDAARQLLTRAAVESA